MERQVYETQEKLPLLIELNLLYSLFNHEKGERKYQHLIRYESGGGGAGGDDEWLGKIRYLQKIIQTCNKEVETKFQDKLSTIKRDMITQINDEIDLNRNKVETGFNKKCERLSNDVRDELAAIKELIKK